jgi:ATP-dependent exoDNAse (exonuclease V) beta subunit
MIPCPKPGIHKDVPEAEYHLWDAVNASLLKTVAKHGPLQARYEQLHPKDPTPDMQFGTKAHTFVLEPLNLPRRSQLDRAAHEEYEQLHAGKEFLKPEKFDLLEHMASWMHSHPEFSKLWRDRIAVEICVVWRDEETGLLCKARIDLVGKLLGHTCIVDYKTTANASAWKFAADMWTFRYDIQAAHYLTSMEALAPGHSRSFIFACQEKKMVCDRMLHSIGPQSLESGRIAWRKALNTWAACVEADEFPGYPTGVGDIEMPPYAINLIE